MSKYVMSCTVTTEMKTSLTQEGRTRTKPPSSQRRPSTNNVRLGVRFLGFTQEAQSSSRAPLSTHSLPHTPRAAPCLLLSLAVTTWHWLLQDDDGFSLMQLGSFLFTVTSLNSPPDTFNTQVSIATVATHSNGPFWPLTVPKLSCSSGPFIPSKPSNIREALKHDQD